MRFSQVAEAEHIHEQHVAWRRGLGFNKLTNHRLSQLVSTLYGWFCVSHLSAIFLWGRIPRIFGTRRRLGSRRLRTALRSRRFELSVESVLAGTAVERVVATPRITHATSLS